MTITLSGGALEEPLRAVTNSFGYYRFEQVGAGQAYIVSVKAKRYTFADPSRVITLNDDLSNEDFIADAR